MTAKKTPAPVEVRQCQDPESPDFGCVAMKSLVPLGDWFVGHPGPNIAACGGGWEQGDARVKDWKVLT